MLDLGSPLPIQSIEVRDAAGVPANAGVVTLVVTKPDGTTASLGFTNPSTGRYVPGVFVADTLAGKYTSRWVGTGINSDATFAEYWVAPVPGVLDWPFASPERLRAGPPPIAADDLPDETAWQVLAEVSSEIRSEAGWSVTEESGRTWTLDGTGGTVLFLPTLRLTAVASVTVDGTALASTAYRWNDVGMIERRDGGRFTKDLRNVVVVGTHGYAVEEIPAVLRGACAEHALRRLAYSDGVVRSVRIDDYAETISSSVEVREISDDPRVAGFRLAFA